ncbi:MAG: transposase [Sterolibacterium sp.]|nr:transposase [Sterolibacterium sp.]
MDLIPNGTFRILKELKPSTEYLPGIYRVILDEPLIAKTVAVLIEPEDGPKRGRGGRRKKLDKDLKRKRKKPPQPLVGDLLWMDRDELQRLSDNSLLKAIKVERRAAPPLSVRGQREYKHRTLAMTDFLDLKKLQESIVIFEGLAGLVRDAMTRTVVSSAFVYRQWSNLCRWGIDERSLMPRRDLSGGPGIKRPCDRGDPTTPGRKKAGRKTTTQRIAMAYGIVLDPTQPGMSSEWSAAIRAADKQIPTPKPSMPKRCNLIVQSAFCAKAKEIDGKIVLVKPEIGRYPNNAQIERALTIDKTRLERLIERTTKAHFKMALRGLIARNWQGVGGPNHTWAIDSTVGDIYLRSSVNRAWIVGRPIVYVIVDVWSTAVVGFYVCLCGPSWNTAKVSLFNAAADPSLVADMWGYQPILTLDPLPTMCYALICDRGEYLSLGHRETALKLILLTSYAPPYRGDLKGLVEVIHRIEKDAQFLFIPGAMDYRRAELELRKVNPEDCVFTVREYTQYLYELFTEYNLTANREHRVTAQMQAAGVFPSPAGLWRWGHAMGIGFRRVIEEADLITELLPSSTGRVRRDAVRHAGCDYTSREIEQAQWTAYARNFGGWDVPLNYYPGAMGPIWTPNVGGAGLLKLQISDESRASPELTTEEWSDVLALTTTKRPMDQHQRKMDSLDSLERIKALRDNAMQLTAEALAKASGSAPPMTEARAIEVAATSHPSRSEAQVKEQVRDEAMQTHQEMMDALLRSANHQETTNETA